LPVDGRRAARLRDRALGVLQGNWREGVHRRSGARYAFTCPSTPRYRHQWYWDSCFHALVWRRFDVARAQAELRTLLSAGNGKGFLPHTVFWDWPAGWRRAPLYATASFRNSLATISIQTPLIALAWEAVADASPDPAAFRAEGLDDLRRHYDWLADRRDPDGDGLITILFPDESGIDDSPKYDPVFGWMAHHRPGYVALVEQARRLRCDARTITERHDRHVEDVLVNVFYALSLHALARMGGGAVYAERAARVERALLDRCLDRETGLFLDLAGRDERQVPVSTWSALAPLALDGLPEDVRRRIVEEHLLDARRYLAPVGIPSVAREEPTFNPRFDRWRCWRGPSWMTTTWLLVPPMRRLGYEAEANQIVRSLVHSVERFGYREYYNPIDGAGLAGRDFGMSTLLVDLL
jgi:glycogen debranching enzyme